MGTCLEWHINLFITTQRRHVASQIMLQDGRIFFDPVSNFFTTLIVPLDGEVVKRHFHMTQMKEFKLNDVRNTMCTFNTVSRFGRTPLEYFFIDFKNVKDEDITLTPKEKAINLVRIVTAIVRGKMPPFAINGVTEPCKLGFHFVPVHVTDVKPKYLRNRAKKPPTGAAKRTKKAVSRKPAASNARKNQRTKKETAAKVANRKPGDMCIVLHNVKPIRPTLDVSLSATDVAIVKKYPQDSPKLTPLSDLRSCSIAEFVRGLQNLGNSCYLNAVLQATVSIEKFMKSVIEFLDYINTNVANSVEFVGVNMPIIKALCDLYRSIRENQEEGLQVLLKKVLTCVGKSVDMFLNNEQEDAHEFLMAMFNALQNEYNAALNKAGLRNRPGLPSEPVVACFGYEIQRRFECITCHHESVNNEKNICFIVDVGEAKDMETLSLPSVIAKVLQPEMIDRRCTNELCNSNRATMTQDFLKLPQIFITAFVRYTFSEGRRRKINTKIDLKSKIKFNRFITNMDVARRYNNVDSVAPPRTTYGIFAGDDYFHMHYNFLEMRVFFNGITVTSEQKKVNNPFALINNNILENSYAEFLRVLTNGDVNNIAHVEKLICDHLLEHHLLYAPLIGKTEKSFRTYINNCKRGKNIHPNLDILACSSIFSTNFWVFDGQNYILFPQLATEPDNRSNSNIFILPDMSNYIYRRTFADQAQFNLNAIVCHQGTEIDEGHYFSFVRAGFSKWYGCDDKLIVTANENQVFHKSRENCYIMFFTKPTLQEIEEQDAYEAELQNNEGKSGAKTRNT